MADRAGMLSEGCPRRSWARVGPRGVGTRVKAGCVPVGGRQGTDSRRREAGEGPLTGA